MFKDYFKLARRNLFKNSISSFINIGGLTIGIAVALLIGLWVYDELSFNRYHKNYDYIAQVNYYVKEEGKQHVQSRQSYLLADVLKTSYGSNFKQVLMAIEPNEYILSTTEKNISRNGQFIEPGGPELFTLNMLAGTWSGLQDFHSILLSASTAKVLFNNTDAIGKIIKINGEVDVKVTGIYEDLPLNSRFHDVQFFSPFDLYVSLNPRVKEQGWKNLSVYIYVQIQPTLSFRETSAKIKDALFDNIKNIEGMKTKIGENPELVLHPMKDWHLYGDFKEGVPDKEPVKLVWMIGIIGSFVLFLACINFMNLATARSEKRAKEVGIRKAVGAGRRQLIGQFISESFLAVIFAFILALILVSVLLPWFNELAAKKIIMPWSNSNFWFVAVGFIMLTSIIAGAYPAFYLSSFQPVKALKNTFRVGPMAAVPRKILVMVQFTISVILIISTIIIFRQTEYAKNRPVGYNGNGLLMIKKKTDEFKGKFELLKLGLKNTGVVYEVAESNSAVTGAEMSNGGFEWRGKDAASNNNFATLSVTREYGNTVGWDFIAGRNFLQDPTSDSTSMVINEAAVKYMGLEKPINEIVRWDPKWRKPQNFRIVGVIKDMVMESPFEVTQPTLFFLYDYNKWINIRLNPNINPHQALPKIEAVFKKIIPNTPFDYQFADQEYALKFAAEERIGKLAALFAALAIFISCLGLFGLASFVAEQRTKEIGIRKVVGATAFDLWKLLSKDFVTLVIISCTIAIPIAYYFMHSWLQDYQYRTNLSWWIFAAASTIAMVITILTVSFHAIKAALANPVKSLRTE